MKKYLLVLLQAFVATFAAFAQDVQSWPVVTRVVSNGDYGSQYYRIPALETCADGSLVAVFDQRGSSQDDLPNNISVVAMRSTDNGATWGEFQYLAQTDNSTTKYGDPLIIRDRNTGVLIVLFVGDYGFFTSTVKGQSVPRIYMTRSYDNGVSWEQITCIHDQVFNTAEWWAAFAASGKMCQLMDGTICALVNARMGSSTASAIHEYVIYTEDCGNTWHTRSGNACTGSYNGNEAKLVELYDGQLLMSMRAPGNRVFNKSTDKGETWGPAYSVPELVEPGCDGDIIRYEYGGRKLLLHSIPYNASTRRNVSVFVSEDDGKTWPIRRTLIEGPSCYSSLTVLQDGTIGCLVEEGGGMNDGTGGIRLDFYRFSLDWLLEGDADDDVDPRKTGTLNLDGSRYMSIAKDDAFNFSTSNPVTVSCRFKTTQSFGSTPRLICNRSWEGNQSNNYGVSGFDMYLGAGANGKNFANNVNPYTGTRWYNLGHPYVGVYNSGEWAHFCWTYDGETSKLYVNGELQDTKTNSNPSGYPLNCVRDILVGAGYSVPSSGTSVAGNYKFTGDIDDVRFYNEVLTAEEVVSDKDATAPLEGKLMIAAYDFSNIEGNVVPDITGNGHDAELINFPVSDGYLMVFTQNSSVMGSYTVTASDGAVIASGDGVAMGTEVMVNCTPSEWYHVKDVWINAERQSVDADAVAFTVQGHTTIYVEFERDADAPVDYCIYDGTLTGDRYTKTLNVSDGTTILDITPCQTSTRSEVYIDKTDMTFSTVAGAEIVVKLTEGRGEWMHHYVYVDYDNDGVFTPDLSASAPFTPSATSELVAFDRYRGTSSTATTYYNSKGDSTTDGQVNPGGAGAITPTSAYITLPSFTIPANIKTGNYRIRFVRAWNSINPCGYDDIKTNGGAIIDFNLYVDSPDAIDNLNIDNNVNAPVEYYNLQGIKLRFENLAPGFYIRRQGSKVEKVFVGK